MMIYISSQLVIKPFISFVRCLASIHIQGCMHCISSSDRRVARVATHSAMAITSNADAHTIQLAYYYRNRNVKGRGQ